MHRLAMRLGPAIVFVAISAFLLLLQGCSLVMVTHQPGQINMGVLTPGMQRADVVAAMGPPTSSVKMPDGGQQETYSFIQGYKQSDLDMRLFGHAVADALTLGLWEAVGTPLETHFSGQKIVLSVTFDSENRVAESKILSTSKPNDSGIKTVADRMVGANPTPVYEEYGGVDAAAILTPEGEPTLVAESIVHVAKIDGYRATFTAGGPRRILADLFKAHENPLRIAPGAHGILVTAGGVVDGPETTEEDGNTVATPVSVFGDCVFQVNFAASGLYRFTAVRDGRQFKFTLWDETQGPDKREILAEYTTFGTTNP